MLVRKACKGGFQPAPPRPGAVRLTVRSRTGLPAALTLLCAACGYVGDPLPPALNIPERITDLRAFQRGDRLVIELTLPALTAEGLGIEELGATELRVAEEAIEVPNRKPGPVRVETGAGRWMGEEVAIRARAVSGRGRPGVWSDTVTLKVIPPLAAPVGLQATPHPKGVRLAWSAPARPGVRFHVYRRAPADKERVLIATADQPEFIDSETRYDIEYQYWAETALDSARSELSAPASITPRDVFAPEVPRSVRAIAGLNSIELTWEPNLEADFKSYRVYRAAPGAKMTQLAEADTPVFSDRTVESGKAYHYAVSSVDQKGNESRLAEAVDITAP